MSTRALYYPHTNITNEVILKNALLLWDKVDTIVPREGWTPRASAKGKLFNEGLELVVVRRAPSQHERLKAHQDLQAAMENGVLTKLAAAAPRTGPSRDFLIYPSKFMERTWNMLRAGDLAYWMTDAQDYGVPPAVGLYMMSLLADACAGTTIQKITDRSDAYTWLSEQHARALGSQNIQGLGPAQVAPSLDRLAGLSLEVVDARDVPLQKLVAMRKREAREGGGDLSAMRRRYLTSLRQHVERMGSQARSANDIKELEREFKNEIRTDLHDLKSELGLARQKALFSSEVLITTLVSAGCLAGSLMGLPLLATQVGSASSVIPLMKAAVDYRGARRTALLKHTSSWLYVMRGRRLQAL